jgi:hypothetical protein
MTTRHAACSCGQLKLIAEGDPVRVSICHCLACQRRTGSAFGVQARFPIERVTVEGRVTEWVRIGDEGSRITFRFCPVCGAVVCYENDRIPGFVGVPVGVFADPAFPPPSVEVYGSRRHPWVGVPADVERLE